MCDAPKNHHPQVGFDKVERMADASTALCCAATVHCVNSALWPIDTVHCMCGSDSRDYLLAGEGTE